jgi:biotin transport system substrate-specific component
MTANSIAVNNNHAMAKNALAVMTASVFVALMAQVSIPLPFTPVPFTMQTFAVYMIAIALGPRLGAMAMAAYICEGACGLPVFSGGAAGAAKLLGPTGGYLLGFVPAAYVIGMLAGKDAGKLRAVAAFVCGAAVFYALGLVQLSRFVPSAFVLKAGLFPFMPGEVVKFFLAAGAVPVAKRLVSRLN